jgi:hypothetical protein
MPTLLRGNRIQSFRANPGCSWPERVVITIDDDGSEHSAEPAEQGYSNPSTGKNVPVTPRLAV